MCKWAVHNGYAPIASHLLYPQFLNEDLDLDRKLGINAGLAWGEKGDEVWFCYHNPTQVSASHGMVAAIKYWQKKNKPIRYMCFDITGNFIREDSEL